MLPLEENKKWNQKSLPEEEKSKKNNSVPTKNNTPPVLKSNHKQMPL